MCFTSDQQLAALGLRRMEDLPPRVGYLFFGRQRDGRTRLCTQWRDENGDFEIFLSGGSAAPVDLIGWRPVE